jgi:hypothetical protein
MIEFYDSKNDVYVFENIKDVLTKCNKWNYTQPKFTTNSLKDFITKNFTVQSKNLKRVSKKKCKIFLSKNHGSSEYGSTIFCERLEERINGPYVGVYFLGDHTTMVCGSIADELDDIKNNHVIERIFTCEVPKGTDKIHIYTNSKDNTVLLATLKVEREELKSLLKDKDWQNPKYIINNINLNYLKKSSVQFPEFNDFYNLIRSKCMQCLLQDEDDDELDMSDVDTSINCLELNNGIVTESGNMDGSYGDSLFGCLDEIHNRDSLVSSLNDQEVLDGTGSAVDANTIELLLNDLRKNKKVDITHKSFCISMGADSVFNVYLYNDKIMCINFNWD